MPTNASTTCISVPPGYFKPRSAFSDVYYICAAGTYSTGGATSCSACASSTFVGATSCPTPMPSTLPSATPTTAPTPGPTLSPTTAPTRVPSAAPTLAPTAMMCPPGTHYSAASTSCVVVSAGYYAAVSGLTAASNCTSAVNAGAASCLSTEAYVSYISGGASTSTDADGVGTNVYWANLFSIALDSHGFAYMVDVTLSIQFEGSR
jgi:hypothetical protein